MCAYGFSCSRRKRGDGGRPAGRRRPGRQRERGGRVGVVRGRGGPRLRSLGRPRRCVGAQAARSEARSACHASLHQYHRTPQPARVTVSVRRSRPPTGHRRAAGGDATTTAPPLPDRRATRGVSSCCDHQGLERSPQNLHRRNSRNGDCSPLLSPKRCVSPQQLRRRLAVVKPEQRLKSYRIDAEWYKPDPAHPGQR